MSAGLMHRRRFVGAAAVTVAVVACGDPGQDDAASLTDTAGADAGDESSSASASSMGDSTNDSGESGAVCDVIWSNISDQTWVVGTPVELDLAPFLEGADAAVLGIVLEGMLPAGITLDGTVLRGTPTAPGMTEIVASVDVASC
jgi:hypothetical protein